MSTWLLIFVTVIYVLIAISFYREDNVGMAITFDGYALANIGLIVVSTKTL